MSEAVTAYLAELRGIAEQALAAVVAASSAPRVINEPVRYALEGPGKRLRPCLVLAAADTVASAAGVSEHAAREMALPGAAAIEMIHTYSLVHDDLPAMDNDDLRRGRATTHKVFGDALAILAGDALLTDAFAVLALGLPAGVGSGTAVAARERRLEAVAVLAAAAGSVGMVGGQAIDIAAVGTAAASVSAETVRDMHARKTGALIRASCALGAILPGAGQAAVAALDQFAAELGLAFQIIDDILDVEAPSALGKTAGKDAAAGKPTFPSMYGLDGSRRLAAECIARGEAALDAAGLGGRLREIGRWSLDRQS